MAKHTVDNQRQLNLNVTSTWHGGKLCSRCLLRLPLLCLVNTAFVCHTLLIYYYCLTLLFGIVTYELKMVELFYNFLILHG